MLDLQQLHDQFSDFGTYQQQERRQVHRQLRLARTALDDAAADWKELSESAQNVSVSWLIAGLRERPDTVHEAPPRPTPITVVASDGSQIYPDRNTEPTCFLLNVSRIAFQYGTLERPIMQSVPSFRYRKDDLQTTFDELDPQPDGKASAEVVSALRDEQELKALLDTAREARVPDRPLVALADGTLIRWMLRGMRNRSLEDALIARYTALLEQFRDEQIPLCSYISRPGNTEVINLLRIQRREHQRPEEDFTDEAPSLAGLPDRLLFEQVLAPGERSAVFESASHIQKAYGVESKICYVYVHVPGPAGAGEVGRIELPAWVAETPALLNLLHAVVLSECEKGDGYPMILSEAHERAVVRAAERDVFYRLIEQNMQAAGLDATGSRKALSKRKPVV